MNTTAPKSIVLSFDQAKEQAVEIISQRDIWPESPVAVCRAFWIARRNKDYPVMEVLWHGSASLNWQDICSNDPKVEYVFGEASIDGKQVPYASKNYFDKSSQYNLTMRLDILATDNGLRFYIRSGN